VTDTADGGAETIGTDAVVSDWEDPPRVVRTDGAPVLAVDGVTGPVDWLLEMVRAQKLDLSKISIAALIGAFSSALETALAGGVGRKIGHWAAWTVMAATLTEMWSRLLLPDDAPEARAAAIEAEALRQHLLARAQMRSGADWLDRRAQLGRDVFRRGQPEIATTGRGGDLTELLRACLVSLHVPDEHVERIRPRLPRLWTASDAISQLRLLLPALPDGSPLTAFLPPIAADAPARVLRQRAALASTLIAGLELARDGALTLDQEAPWTSIRVNQRLNGCPLPRNPGPAV
jgi:segregation and condensation protein A